MTSNDDIHRAVTFYIFNAILMNGLIFIQNLYIIQLLRLSHTLPVMVTYLPMCH